ncbi:MAG TPA: radical SAM protein [Anaerolineales bacterium]|nr:radical SAM protein [Anaerolineales bacterium]HLO27608.1 radical SAM protein [Anaerolineales bacterium]
MATTIGDLMDKLTVTGELYRKLSDNTIECYACGHRCKIREGKRGICQVRFNEGGELRVPWGYVAALQSDPIEKKPFFHVNPGTNALTFGMLGCDFHCGYCFTGNTMVITNRGPIALQDAFDHGVTLQKQPDGDISIPFDLKAITSSGDLHKVRAVFRHPYEGKMVKLKPYYLPSITCTPDHRVYATDDITVLPAPVYAKDLTKKHYLAVPRSYKFSSPQVIDAEGLLGSYPVTFQTPWKLSGDEMQKIMDLSVEGKSSREIGEFFGKSGSYIRHLRSKIRTRRVHENKTSYPYIENGYLRFPNERHSGIPLITEVGADIAELLGYYCAEGSVALDKNRPNSYKINFSFSKNETGLANRVIELLQVHFGVDAKLVNRRTTLAVSVSKVSLALLLKTLAGERSTTKRVPKMLFEAPREVVKAFLDAYIQGDGHRFANGKLSSTTVSRELAYGIALLALKCGYFPSVYDALMPETGMIEGRVVHRAPHQYTIVWYEESFGERKIISTEKFYLVPIREIASETFNGHVFNMEVEEEHNYLANFLLVSNCQNWLTSQAMRDPSSDESINYIRKISPQEMVHLAHRTHASTVVSSYNEPLITSEWAVDIFKEAKAAGLMCAYVSNGNNTPEVMEYIRPYISAYKVDLKCMQDKNYRKLGGVLQNTLDGIKRAHEMGLWVEIVTLTIPGFNDSNEELWDAARFIAGVSKDIPWHVTAFHKDYKMTDPDNTDARTLLRAAEIGGEAGLRFVYAGNLPGQVGEYEDTFCPQCNYRLIQRSGYIIHEYHITAAGTCPKCNTRIPGLWPKDPSKVVLNGLGIPLPVH